MTNLTIIVLCFCTCSGYRALCSSGKKISSRFGRSGNPNLVGSNRSRIKPLTLKFILVLPSQGLGIIRIGQGLVGLGTG